MSVHLRLRPKPGAPRALARFRPSPVRVENPLALKPRQPAQTVNVNARVEAVYLPMYARNENLSPLARLLSRVFKRSRSRRASGEAASRSPRQALWQGRQATGEAAHSRVFVRLPASRNTFLHPAFARLPHLGVNALAVYCRYPCITVNHASIYAHISLHKKKGIISVGCVLCRVEDWRSCLGSPSITLFPVPAHRTGHALLRHPALGQDIMLSPTEGCGFAAGD